MIPPLRAGAWPACNRQHSASETSKTGGASGITSCFACLCIGSLANINLWQAPSAASPGTSPHLLLSCFSLVLRSGTQAEVHKQPWWCRARAGSKQIVHKSMEVRTRWNNGFRVYAHPVLWGIFPACSKHCSCGWHFRFRRRRCLCVHCWGSLQLQHASPCMLSWKCSNVFERTRVDVLVDRESAPDHVHIRIAKLCEARHPLSTFIHKYIYTSVIWMYRICLATVF